VDSSGSGGAGDGSCEHGNEVSGSIKDTLFLDYLSVLFICISRRTLLRGVR
jgi:hypothetical protein